MRSPWRPTRATPATWGDYLERSDSERIVQSARLWAAESPRLNYQLIITLASGATVIGCAGLRQTGYPPGEAEVGIELDPEYLGRRLRPRGVVD